MPCSTWDLLRPGIKPTSPALAGRFYTTEPAGKPFNARPRSFAPPHPHAHTLCRSQQKGGYAGRSFAPGSPRGDPAMTCLLSPVCSAHSPPFGSAGVPPAPAHRPRPPGTKVTTKGSRSRETAASPTSEALRHHPGSTATALVNRSQPPFLLKDSLSFSPS